MEVSLPKFKMEQSYSLHRLLPDMGMASVFSNSANLTRLSKDKGLKVSEVSFVRLCNNIIINISLQIMNFFCTLKIQVLHKAVIEVDETGTTAAAATTSGITPYALPRTFMVNRPFFFFIYHEGTNCLLFMGRVIDPTKN